MKFNYIKRYHELYGATLYAKRFYARSFILQYECYGVNDLCKYWLEEWDKQHYGENLF
jgi:hypothetical protein